MPFQDWGLCSSVPKSLSPGGAQWSISGECIPWQCGASKTAQLVKARVSKPDRLRLLAPQSRCKPAPGSCPLTPPLRCLHINTQINTCKKKIRTGKSWAHEKSEEPLTQLKPLSGRVGGPTPSQFQSFSLLGISPETPFTRKHEPGGGGALL